MADGNIVVYFRGKAGTRILFSCDEIAQLLSLSEVDDDLTKTRYTHPDFESDRLGELRNQVAALGLDVRNTTFTSAELDEMKTAAAARIIERHLRESGVSLSPNMPLLTTGLLSSGAHSPKLTAALRDQGVLERLVRANDPNLSRALIRLTRLGVVELSYP